MQGFEYHVDLVYCIDATGSMHPVMDEVKANALKLHGEIISALADKDKFVDKMRIKVIAFRDVYDNPETAFEISEFFELPKFAKEFESFVARLDTVGGGDEPESALEGLALALKTNWTALGTKRRHVIVLWTDASAHPLEKASSGKPAGYPQGLPSSFNDLADLWEGHPEAASKRLLVFAPDAHPWALTAEWPNAVWYPSRAGSGLDDLSHQEILSAVVNSLG